MLYGACLTATVFSARNLLLLTVRVPADERGFGQLTEDYGHSAT